MAGDPLRQLVDLPGVSDAVESARDALAEVHRHPTNRRGWPATSAEASVRAARASAAIDGASPELPEDGQVDDPRLAGALRVAESLGLLLTTWERAPLQALARLHVLAAADLVHEREADALGRPQLNEDGTARLDLLAKVVTTTKVPGPVLYAVVHGELLTLRPFGTADGVIARAAGRLVAIGTGLDPRGLGVPEVSYLRRPHEYASAADAFATGTADGVAGWISYCCKALEAGAKEATSIADAASPS
ncbi:oxidoreductase [Pseudonocardiaceae bacterium YIM PH 21723]|nr:oxidoreductase [Pseudonocardiaceae bacterium YIM PH 21723]